MDLAPLTPDQFVPHCQAEGFTPAEAAAFYAELVALGSPVQFEPQRLRRTPWLRALAHWHRLLRAAIVRVRTVEDWVDYCHHWAYATFEGPHVSEGHFTRQGSARGFLFTHWPLLAMGEPEAAFERRCSGPWLEPDPTLRDWAALDARVAHPRLLRRLLDAVENPLPRPRPLTRVRQEWARTLRATGLRSVRWHWSEALAPAEMRGLRLMLDEVQDLLARPLGWPGPVLGLAGATALELIAGQEAGGQGHVRLDPFPTGQPMMVDARGVIPHEWLHTLDATLARDTGQTQRYLTLALADDEPTLPDEPVLAQAGGAWWTMVGQIQADPLPDAVRSAVQADLARWPERLVASLGDTAALHCLIGEEQARMAGQCWQAKAAVDRWEAWLALHLQADAALAHGTAAWLVRDLALAANLDQVPTDQPVWAWFMHTGWDTDPQGTQDPSRLKAHYLAHPIELMARSFEAAFGPDEGEPDPVWRVARSQAGMIWPLPGERTYQRVGWVACLAELLPWWQLRCKIQAPLSRVIRHHRRVRWRMASDGCPKPDRQNLTRRET